MKITIDTNQIKNNVLNTATEIGDKATSFVNKNKGRRPKFPKVPSFKKDKRDDAEEFLDLIVDWNTQRLMDGKRLFIPNAISDETMNQLEQTIYARYGEQMVRKTVGKPPAPDLADTPEEVVFYEEVIEIEE